MVTPLEFAVFTIGPICVMGAMIVYSSVKIPALEDKGPIILIALLLLMTLHQVTEVLQYTSGTFYQTTSPGAEAFETGANVVASVASYFVLQRITDLRATRYELESTNVELEERSSMVRVLNRVLRHNVRNDVNIIALQTADVREEIDDDRVRRKLDTIEDRAWGLERISDHTQRIRQLLTEGPTSTTELRLGESLEPPIERVESAVSNATIELESPEETELPIEGPSTFPYAVADVVEQIVTTNNGSEPVDVTVTLKQSSNGRDGESVLIEIDDDGGGLPEMDVRAIENDEETSLRHAEGLSLWCLEWAVRRADGELYTDLDDETVKIRLPGAS